LSWFIFSKRGGGVEWAVVNRMIIHQFIFGNIQVLLSMQIFKAFESDP
tara:strand:- start:636 stop:779 length:144 start_codon:yes stop_codon:yes gene_type:complete